MLIEVFLPKLGESIVSATIARIIKKEGDSIRKDEPLMEVTTEKLTSEIPSPETGVVKQISVAENQEVQVGDLIAIIETEEEPQDIFFFSPAVLRLAEERKISKDELKSLAKKLGRRVTRQDLNEIEEKADNIQRIEMSTMRKKIADNMVKSFYQAPHATLITEVDVTDILEEIQKMKESFYAKHQTKLTITSFLAKAIASSLKEYPLINSSLEEETIVMKNFVNLGIAVNIKEGLVVPVLKDCEKKELSEIAVEIDRLASGARKGILSLDDLSGGSITLTNFGMGGVEIGIPIIRYPEVAIIAFGAIVKKPVVKNNEIVIRSAANISLTFDHRVLDGMYGCGFLNELKNTLENIRSI